MTKRQRHSNQIAQKKQNRPTKGRTPKPFARAPLKPSVRTSTSTTPPTSTPTPDPFAIGRLGPWTILRLSDQTGKRGWARCGHCAAIHEISLVGDTPPSCGCIGPRSIASRSAFAEAAFAVGLRKRART
jgi:hypothetical protein